MDIDINDSLCALILIQKSPYTHQMHRQWAESGIFKLLNCPSPRMTSVEIIEVLTELFLDNNRPVFTNKGLKRKIEKYLLDIYRLGRIGLLLKKVQYIITMYY